MPTSSHAAALQFQIDLIAVPVFVADKRAGDDFRIVVINTAHANLTGLDKVAVQGRTPLEILGDSAAAQEVVTRYTACIDAEGPVCYREKLPFQGEVMTFDTTLQKIPRPRQGIIRIVGTSLKLDERPKVEDDIQFYLALARNSLTTIEMLMRAVPDERSLSIPERDATRILSQKALLSLEDLERTVFRMSGVEELQGSELSSAVREFILH
jgi:hypothetical protein